MEILQVKDVYKDFSGLKVLMGVTFTVKANEKHAIIGPNGAGKTTLSTLSAANIDLHPDPFCSEKTKLGALPLRP